MARNTKLVKIAKILRQRMTKAESVLWQELRDNQLGMKFRRQMPFVFGSYHYITDFYCPKLKLIIEIDGGIHNDPEVKEIDEFREDVFKTAGYRVMRFKNEEVINSLSQVIRRIKQEINTGAVRLEI